MDRSEGTSRLGCLRLRKAIPGARTYRPCFALFEDVTDETGGARDGEKRRRHARWQSKRFAQRNQGKVDRWLAESQLHACARVR